MEEIIKLEETYNLVNFHYEVDIRLVKIVDGEKTVLKVDECFTDLDELNSFRREWLRLEYKLKGLCDIDKIKEDLLSYLLGKKVCIELDYWISAEDLKDPLVLKCKIKDKLEKVRQLFNTAKESREKKLSLIKSILN